MTEIRISVLDKCKNSPKKSLIVDYIISWAKGDFSFLDKITTEEVVWNIIGDKIITNKKNMFERLSQNSNKSLKEIRIDDVISHGNIVSANGEVNFIDKTYAFCNIYKFNSFSKQAKIKEIISYIIET